MKILITSWFIFTLFLIGALIKETYRLGYLEGRAKVYEEISQMPEDRGNCYALQPEHKKK